LKKLGGLKFRRQVPLHGYVVDFLCVELKLVIDWIVGSMSTRPLTMKSEQAFWVLRDIVCCATGMTMLCCVLRRCWRIS